MAHTLSARGLVAAVAAARHEPLTGIRELLGPVRNPSRARFKSGVVEQIEEQPKLPSSDQREHPHRVAAESVDDAIASPPAPRWPASALALRNSW